MTARTRSPRRRTDPSTEQPAANPTRGEHELTLAGVTYRLRPSFTAIVAIEQKTGETTLALVRRGNTMQIPLADLGIIAAELIREGADPKDQMTRSVNAERIEELIFEEGLQRVTPRLTLCLLDAATGGRTASGEAKAAAA